MDNIEEQFFGDTEVRGLAVDEHGNSYLVGAEFSTASVFLLKYDSSGDMVWDRKFTATVFPDPDFAGFNEPWDVEVDGLGNVFVTGHTTANIAKEQSGAGDAFLLQYNADGELLRTEQFGPFDGYEWGLGIAIGAEQDVYVSGFTYGDFGGMTPGVGDAYLVKFRVPIPEPPAAILLVVGMTLFASIRFGCRAPAA